MPGTGPGGGKAANSRKNVGRRPTREGLCHILERWSESLEERDESELEKCGTELGNTGPGTSAGTVDFLWCCTTMLFIKITLSEPKASL